VTGGFNPTGSIVFNLYGPNDLTCSNAAIYSQTVGLTAGSATTTPGFTTLAAGTYEWTASYAGDTNNNAASSGCGAEAVTISKNSPTLPPTNSISGGSSGPSDNAWLLVIALGLFLAAVVMMTPTRFRRRR
jgi:hypothetical protein